MYLSKILFVGQGEDEAKIIPTRKGKHAPRGAVFCVLHNIVRAQAVPVGQDHGESKSERCEREIWFEERFSGYIGM